MLVRSFYPVFNCFAGEMLLQKQPLRNGVGTIFLFLKKDVAASKELEKLISSLEEQCSYEPAGFNRAGIKQYILDVFNQRRRCRRKGHDYSQVRSFSFLLSLVVFFSCLFYKAC